MGVFTGILTAPVLAPIKGVTWVVDTLASHAERELYDEDNIRKELAVLEQRYELGEIGEDDFEAAEDALLARLQRARSMKEQG